MDLPDMQTVRQISESPWYVGLGALVLLAGKLGWAELEKRWAHRRAIELEKWRHEHNYELELLEHAGEGASAVRAAAEAVRSLRTTQPGADPAEKPPLENVGVADPAPGQRPGGRGRRRRGR